MSKILLLISVLVATIFLWVAVYFDIIPPIFWTLKEFSNPSYFAQLSAEWEKKQTDFLLRELHSIDSRRFSIAASILATRKEQKAIGILIARVRSKYVDNGIHYWACGALAQISPQVARSVLESVLDKYGSIKKNSPLFNGKYKNALQILASMKDERVYPICLQMAKHGDRLEKESSLNGMLYYFDNHIDEILPIYLSYLNDPDSSKGQIIKIIGNFWRPEAIPVLEEFASKNKNYEKDAREAIKYLEMMKK